MLDESWAMSLRKLKGYSIPMFKHLAEGLICFLSVMGVEKHSSHVICRSEEVVIHL